METKFTPAPWAFTDGTDYVLTEGGRMICDMSYSGRQEHSDYNGNLIKTAPKLYEALEKSIAWLSIDSDFLNSPLHKELSQVLAEARGVTNE